VLEVVRPSGTDTEIALVQETTVTDLFISHVLENVKGMGMLVVGQIGLLINYY